MDGYDEFAATHVDRLLQLARLLTGDREEAEDLTQEVLGQVLRKWDRVGGAAHQLAYVRRMLVNLHTSRARRRAVVAVPLDTLVSEPPATQPVSLEDRDELRRAVAGLPPRQRTVLVLRFYEDLDIDEIAAAMRISSSSVRSALSRALGTLRSTTFQEAHRD